MNIQYLHAAALLSSAMILSPNPGAAQDDTTEAPIYVRTLIVSEPADTISRQFFGRVAALDTVALGFNVGGELTLLEAPEGSIVAAGTILAELDTDPFERAVERAELALAQATRDLERAQTLAERNVTTEVNVLNAQTAVDLSEVELREARAALADARIVAPFDGLIADRLASNHSIIEPGEPIVRLHDLSETRIEIELPERLLRQVGEPGAVTFSGAIEGLGSEFDLEFREFRAETGAVGQSYTLSLAVVGDDAPPLLPGQTTIVRAAVPNQDIRPSLPASALMTAPNDTHFVVSVVGEGDMLLARHVPVEVDAPTGSTLYIEGIAPGTEIVAIGAHTVPDGAELARYPGLIRETE